MVMKQETLFWKILGKVIDRCRDDSLLAIDIRWVSIEDELRIISLHDGDVMKVRVNTYAYAHDLEGSVYLKDNMEEYTFDQSDPNVESIFGYEKFDEHEKSRKLSE